MVNVKTDLPLVTQYHAFSDEFVVWINHLYRETDQVYSAGTALLVTPGIPTPGPLGSRIQYDGTLDTLRGTNGQLLLPFDLPIVGT